MIVPVTKVKKYNGSKKFIDARFQVSVIKNIKYWSQVYFSW